MSEKILICHDQEGVREVIKSILEGTHELLLTDSGEQALDFLDNAKDIGIVFIDIDMQEWQKIKEKRPELKVIVVAGHKSEQAAKEAVQSGIDAYILKPFKSEEILSLCK